MTPMLYETSVNTYRGKRRRQQDSKRKRYKFLDFPIEEQCPEAFYLLFSHVSLDCKDCAFTYFGTTA